MTGLGYILRACIIALLLFTGLQNTLGQTVKHILPTLKVVEKTAEDTIRICILGDMMMHEAQITKAAQKDGSYDFSTYFQFIEDDIRNADIAIANMEYTLAGMPYSGYPCFSAPESFATYLAECGFDIFLAANNHIFDKGHQGADKTLQFYRKLQESHNIRFTGLAGDESERASNHPLIINCDGTEIAILNFTYGTNLGSGAQWPKVNYMSDKGNIEEALRSSKGSDLTIALPHWGEEYTLKHSDNQRITAEWLCKCGADIIIGSHPHVVQDQETIEGCHVIYSLGNAVSNMSAANTQIELMVILKIVRHHNGKVKLLDPEFQYLWCSRPGGYCSSYTVIPVKEFIGTKDEWQGTWEYDKMISTYERVRQITGIKEN